MDSSKVIYQFVPPQVTQASWEGWVQGQSPVVVVLILLILAVFIFVWKVLIPKIDKWLKYLTTEAVNGIKGEISSLKSVVERQGKELTKDREKQQERSEQHAERLFGSLNDIGSKLAAIDRDVLGLKDKVANIDGRVTDLEKRK